MESCLDCGKPVSSNADVCPHCGSTGSNSKALAGGAMLLLLLIFSFTSLDLYDTGLCWAIVVVGGIVWIMASGMNQYEED